MNNKLTQSEWEGLVSYNNFADGHAHQDQTVYLSVVDRLSEIYTEADTVPQNKIQNDFEKLFFKLAGQLSYADGCKPIYNYGCSISIEVVANYFKKKDITVSLIHPTFDNLADILKRNEVKLECLDESWLAENPNSRKEITTDAIFIVCPNNPTGQNITRTQYESLVDYCAKHDKLLIVDCSFRFYGDLHTWDQYGKLNKSGIDYIVFEDTGKTWPTMDLKLGITVASKSVYDELLKINDDFLLNVSPFIFRLLTEYIKVDLENGHHVQANGVVAQNRNVLRKLIVDTPLQIMNDASTLSVEWVKLPENWSASSFTKWLKTQDFHVLPGMPFFWNTPEVGEQYVRIAPCSTI